MLSLPLITSIFLAALFILGLFFFFRLQHYFNQNQNTFNDNQLNFIRTIQAALHQGLEANRNQIKEYLNDNTKQTAELTKTIEVKLAEISGQVEKRLNEGFEKSKATFYDVIKRLTIIDEAQKKITELSSSVVSLQEILTDKRSRGAFGEVQLKNLIENVLSPNNYSWQYTFSNNTRADCVLFLPEPTGHIAIDAKFPLEFYQKMMNIDASESDRKLAEQEFRKSIKIHIKAIADKYIIPNETGDGAIMFLPAEAIFAEIHAHYPELVEYSHQSRVWLASPTTMMAILNTARAVLKDAATRKQVHIIQEHLRYLHQDFKRFQERMDKLAQHVTQAHTDIQQVHSSAKKITSRFSKIENVELSLLEENITTPECLEDPTSN